VAVYAIGDIQGCYDALCRLLEHLRFEPSSDQLWSTGDLVNRGPQSLETLRLVHGLGDSARTVLGNHDIHLLAIAEGFALPKRNDTVADILTASDGAELLNWLRHRPLLHESPRLPGRVLVHAGIAPAWTLGAARIAAGEVEEALRGPHYRDFLHHLYGNRPDRWSEALTGWDRLRYITNAFTRMRFCAADGRLLLDFKGAPEQAPEGYLSWFEVPGRVLEHDGVQIICGHWSMLGLVCRDDLLALDTGCLWGGKLTAVRLDAGEGITTTPCEAALEPGPGR